jgi:hypothetical protein
MGKFRIRTIDYHVDRLETLEVRRYGKAQRRHLGWADAERIDPLCLETALRRMTGSWGDARRQRRTPKR